MEQFQNNLSIEEYNRNLGMQYAIANVTRKIWTFMDDIFNYSVVRNKKQ